MIEAVELPDSTVIPNNDAPSIRSSDLITFYPNSSYVDDVDNNIGFVLNNSLLFVAEGQPLPGPNTFYPFKRLAWVKDSSADAIYFYHQLDENVLAEDTFYMNGSGWRTTAIPINVNS